MTATADPEPRQPDWRREFREFDADGDKVLHVEYRDAKPIITHTETRHIRTRTTPASASTCRCSCREEGRPHDPQK